MSMENIRNVRFDLPSQRKPSSSTINISTLSSVNSEQIQRAFGDDSSMSGIVASVNNNELSEKSGNEKASASAPVRGIDIFNELKRNAEIKKERDLFHVSFSKTDEPQLQTKEVLLCHLDNSPPPPPTHPLQEIVEKDDLKQFLTSNIWEKDVKIYNVKGSEFDKLLSANKFYKIDRDLDNIVIPKASFRAVENYDEDTPIVYSEEDLQNSTYRKASNKHVDECEITESVFESNLATALEGDYELEIGGGVLEEVGNGCVPKLPAIKIAVHKETGEELPVNKVEIQTLASSMTLRRRGLGKTLFMDDEEEEEEEEEEEASENVEMSEDVEVSESERNEKPAIMLTPCGLDNYTGTFCYANSVFQCLGALPHLMQHVLSTFEGNMIAAFREPKNGSLRALQFETYNALKKLRFVEDKAAFSLQDVGNLFAQYFPLVSPERQEDAHEFLGHLLDGIFFDECNSYLTSVGHPRVAPLTDNAIRSMAMIHPMHKNNTMINSTFAFDRHQVKTCMHQHKSERVTEKELCLTLALTRDGRTLEELLHNDCAKRLHNAENSNQQLECDDCKKKTNGSIKPKLNSVGKALIIHLKRWRNNGAKNLAMIKFPLQLDLTPFMHEPEHKETRMQLTGVVVHVGATQKGGHYYACVRLADGSWMKCDDKKVEPIEEGAVLRRQAYMLFYSRASDLEKVDEVNAKKMPRTERIQNEEEEEEIAEQTKVARLSIPDMMNHVRKSANIAIHAIRSMKAQQKAPTEDNFLPPVQKTVIRDGVSSNINVFRMHEDSMQSIAKELRTQHYSLFSFGKNLPFVQQNMIEAMNNFPELNKHYMSIWPLTISFPYITLPSAFHESHVRDIRLAGDQCFGKIVSLTFAGTPYTHYAQAMSEMHVRFPHQRIANGRMGTFKYENSLRVVFLLNSDERGVEVTFEYEKRKRNAEILKIPPGCVFAYIEGALRLQISPSSEMERKGETRLNVGSSFRFVWNFDVTHRPDLPPVGYESHTQFEKTLDENDVPIMPNILTGERSMRFERPYVASHPWASPSRVVSVSQTWVPFMFPKGFKTVVDSHGYKQVLGYKQGITTHSQVRQWWSEAVFDEHYFKECNDSSRYTKKRPIHRGAVVPSLKSRTSETKNYMHAAYTEEEKKIYAWRPLNLADEEEETEEEESAEMEVEEEESDEDFS